MRTEGTTGIIGKFTCTKYGQTYNVEFCDGGILHDNDHFFNHQYDTLYYKISIPEPANALEGVKIEFLYPDKEWCSTHYSLLSDNYFNY